MRHTDFHGLEKSAKILDDDYTGVSGRSVDDHYNYPYSPNTSDEFIVDGSNRTQHSLFTFIAPKPKAKQEKTKKKNKAKNTIQNVEEEDLPPNKHVVSSEFFDTQFDMDTDDSRIKPTTEGKFND